MFETCIKSIAAAYGRALAARPAAPNETVRAAWAALADAAEYHAAGVRLLLEVTETDAPEPYPDAAAMFADIDRGRFTVSRANSAHPLWDVPDNVNFRIAHDVLGHYAARMAGRAAGFDWRGECDACAAHVRILPADSPARRAMFCECLGQTAYAIDRGRFPAQVCADLYPDVADIGGGRPLDFWRAPLAPLAPVGAAR